MTRTAMPDGIVLILASLSLAASIVYAAVHLLVLAGFFRRRAGVTPPRTTMSVIVAARDEAGRIGATLDSLARQSRAPDEVIIVDDRSTDGTRDVVERYRTRWPGLRTIRIETLPEGVAPKKHALSVGVSASSGDVLCFTDADVQLPPTWLETIASHMTPEVGVVVGFYIPEERPSEAGLLGNVLQRFIAYEKFKTAVLSAGSIGWGFAWTASGSNLAYRRSVYDQVGGFSGQHASISGDDDLFVQRVRRDTDWTIVAMTDPKATVVTETPGTWSDFVRQRVRHLSAGRWYDAPSSAALALYHGSNVLATIALLGWIVAPDARWLMGYIIKVCADLVLCSFGDLRLSRPKAWTWFLPLEILNVVYIAVLGTIGRWSNIVWKEHRVIS